MSGDGIGLLSIMAVVFIPVFLLRSALSVFMVPALACGVFFKKVWWVILSGAGAGVLGYLGSKLLPVSNIRTYSIPELYFMQLSTSFLPKVAAGIEVALIVWLIKRLVRRVARASRGADVSRAALQGKPETSSEGS